MRRLILAITLITCFASAQQPTGDRWSAWQPFLGTWEGAGSGEPGKGSGTFTFARELQGAVLVRRSYAQYPATKHRTEYRHDDLMIIYPEAGKTRADYWDNESHVIHYLVEFREGGHKLVMVSEPAPSSPRYRLTYLITGGNDLKLTFEIAPPDAPENFKTYIEAAATRKTK